jgi:2-amino-1-hydroxyethylphosphonate dioxygenase (glycine-forming)
MTPRERILTLLRDAQGQYFGESVTQLEHALQCADLARASGADNEMILAALLHDIGHLIAVGDETGSPDHDRIGATFLKELRFSERVTELVSGHVQAKRYLAWMEPSYQKQLSSASKHTLAQQGGPMSSEEARDFEQDRLFAEKIKLRHWDELAKSPVRTPRSWTPTPSCWTSTCPISEPKPQSNLNIPRSAVLRALRRGNSAKVGVRNHQSGNTEIGVVEQIRE